MRAGVAIILDAMKTLLLLRHAKSSWKHPELADHDRPLNKRGKRTAPRVSALLQDEDLIPDLILCSSAVRAHTTALLVAKACAYAGESIEYASFSWPSHRLTSKYCAKWPKNMRAGLS